MNHSVFLISHILIKTLILSPLLYFYLHVSNLFAHDHLFIYLFIYLFILFRAAPTAYGSSQVRGLIRAAGLYQSHSNAGSEPNLQHTPQLMAMPDP